MHHASFGTRLARFECDVPHTHRQRGSLLSQHIFRREFAFATMGWVSASVMPRRTKADGVFWTWDV